MTIAWLYLYPVPEKKGKKYSHAAIYLEGLSQDCGNSSAVSSTGANTVKH